MSRLVLLGAATLLSLAASSAHALTPREKCQDAISTAGRTYFLSVEKARRKCEDTQAVSGAPADCAVDAVVTTAVTKAQAKLSAKLTAKCTDMLIDEATLGVPCTGISTVAGTITCIQNDAHGQNVTNIITTNYDAIGQITDAALRACQATVGKEATKLADARIKQYNSCAKKLMGKRGAGKDDPMESCPNAKTQLVLEKARDKFAAKVTAKCSDAQVVNAAIDFGYPCDSFELTVFDRDGVTNNNLIPAATRLARCIGAAAAGNGDHSANAANPLSETEEEFENGVAAGDATDTAFIVWTRAASGATTSLEVSTSPTLEPTVVSLAGLLPVGAADNTIKTEVTGLSPSTTYYYQFKNANGDSRIGRIKTAPAPSATTPVKFAWTGDANAFFQPYNVLDRMRLEDLDTWLFIGDTIYGDDPRSGSGVATVRSDYHTKYKENRADRALRDAMATRGFYTIWDDHEVTNDFWGLDPSVATQMAAGNQAFRDFMPMREDGGDPMKLYRSYKWGQVAEFFLIDDRQYRSAQAYITNPADCAPPPANTPSVLPGAGCQVTINDPGRAYLGATQMAWLKNALQTSTAKFKFIMNGPLVTPLLFLPYDRWDGYGAERLDLLSFIATNNINNVVFLSTDIHAAIINDAVTVPGLPAGPRARELVSGAIGMDSIFRELPPSVLALVGSLPGFFPTVSYYDIDRFNYASVEASMTQAVVSYRDISGALLKTYTIPAL